MLRYVSIALLLSALACQSTGYGLRRPSLSRMPDKTPGPIVVPANSDIEADNELLPETAPDSGVNPVPNAVPDQTPAELPDEMRVNSAAIHLGEADPSKNKNLPYGLLTLTSNADSWIISRPQYVMSWNPKTRNLNWVAWLMNTAQFGSVGRQPNFTVDPDLKEYIADTSIKAVTTSDYTGSCYDRGHQVASSDRQATREDNVATFYTTNIIPQTAFLNQIIWKKFEGDIKDWLTQASYKNLWVVAGPIYGSKLSYMGPDESIAVPNANFKAVFAWDDASKDKPYLVKAVIMPNVLSNGEDPNEDPDRRCQEATSGGHVKGEETLSQAVDDYLATIPAIEAAAHLRFPSAVRP